MAGWVLPNRKRFIDDTAARFKYDTTVYTTDQAGCDGVGGPSGSVSLFEHQRIVARFLADETPYRGLLLYHGLGAGKSCAAIHAAAQHAGRRRTVVLLPAALEANFVGEVAKCGRAGPSTKWRFEPLNGAAALSAAASRTGLAVTVLRRNGGLWVEDDAGGTALARLPPAARAQVLAQTAAEMTFFHYNGLTRAHMGTLRRLLDTEPCVVIIDEVHNFISRAINNPASLTGMLHTLLCSSRTIRVIALSGTPFLNHPREIAFLVNLVKGFEHLMEMGIRAPTTSKSDVALAVVRDLGACKLVDHVDRLDFQHGRMRIRMAPQGFRRVEGTELFAPDPISTIEAGLAEVRDALSRHGVGVVGEPREVQVPLMPQDVEGFFEAFVDEATLSIKNKDMFRRRMLGFVSHFGFQNRELFPTIRGDEVIRCDMHPHQAKRYMEVRADEIKTEEGVAKRRAALNMLDAPGQVYKTFSRMACNFVFPTGIKRPYPSTMDDLTAEEGGGGDSTYEGAIARAVAAVAKGGTTHLGRELSHNSTKFSALLDRLETSPGTVLVYSQFRKVEGIALLAEALIVRGFTELRARGATALDLEGEGPARPRFIVYDGTSQLLLDVFNSNFAALPPPVLEQLQRTHGPDVSNVRGEVARVLLITQSGAEGISLRNVRQVHILEPYWNNIRLDQVIGRAVRTCSHAALPRGDRNVQVYRYVSVLPRALVPPTSRVMIHDGGRTADELVMSIAERKTRVMREILDMMREVAVDCAAHRELHEGVTCYAFSEPKDGLAYDIDIAQDELAGQDGRQVAQVVEIKHKQYLLMVATKDLYDYKLYKRGILRYVGRLVPITRDGRKGFYIREP